MNSALRNKLTNGHLEFRCKIGTCLRPLMYFSSRLKPNLLSK
jgi:hypothetical protein